MDIRIYDSPAEMAEKTAWSVASLIRQNPGRLICFAAGDTPLGMLRGLVRLQEEGGCDLRSMYYAGLDEWIGLGYGDKGSCAQVMKDAFYTPAGIPPEHMCIFDGLAQDADAECRKMEGWIKARGGLFLTVLGVGMNGHIGFNEPFGPDREGCFTIALDATTRAVSEKYFGKSLPVTAGITIGWRTLLTSERMFVLASGKNKASIIEQAFAGKPSSAVPASRTQEHGSLVVALDKEAAARLKNG